jgi:hypothetical protein
MTGRADYYEFGGYNAVCYECGRKRKASTLKKTWQGYFVCPEHWEPRQPQDFVRVIPDIITPPWAQPMPQDHFRFGDVLITEQSDLYENLDMILTENFYPITTE